MLHTAFRAEYGFVVCVALLGFYTTATAQKPILGVYYSSTPPITSATQALANDSNALKATAGNDTLATMPGLADPYGLMGYAELLRRANKNTGEPFEVKYVDSPNKADVSVRTYTVPVTDHGWLAFIKNKEAVKAVQGGMMKLNSVSGRTKTAQVYQIRYKGKTETVTDTIEMPILALPPLSAYPVGARMKNIEYDVHARAIALCKEAIQGQGCKPQIIRTQLITEMFPGIADFTGKMKSAYENYYEKHAGKTQGLGAAFANLRELTKGTPAVYAYNKSFGNLNIPSLKDNEEASDNLPGYARHYVINDSYIKDDPFLKREKFIVQKDSILGAAAFLSKEFEEAQIPESRKLLMGFIIFHYRHPVPVLNSQWLNIKGVGYIDEIRGMLYPKTKRIGSLYYLLQLADVFDAEKDTRQAAFCRQTALYLSNSLETSLSANLSAKRKLSVLFAEHYAAQKMSNYTDLLRLQKGLYDVFLNNKRATEEVDYYHEKMETLRKGLIEVEKDLIQARAKVRTTAIAGALAAGAASQMGGSNDALTKKITQMVSDLSLKVAKNTQDKAQTTGSERVTDYLRPRFSPYVFDGSYLTTESGLRPVAADVKFFLTLDYFNFLPVVETFAAGKPKLIAAIAEAKLHVKDTEKRNAAFAKIYALISNAEATCQQYELEGKPMPAIDW